MFPAKQSELTMLTAALKLKGIKQTLKVEILPGTEVMTDVGSTHFVKSKHKRPQVLIPQPTDDPHDPLNWSLPWKISTIVASSMVTFSQGLGPLALAPIFPYYMEKFHSSLNEVIQFTGVCVLVLGFSNFIW